PTRRSSDLNGRPWVSTGVKPGWARPVRMSSRVASSGVSIQASCRGTSPSAEPAEVAPPGARARTPATTMPSTSVHAIRTRRLPVRYRLASPCGRDSNLQPQRGFTPAADPPTRSTGGPPTGRRAPAPAAPAVPEKNDLIRQIVREDLASGKHTAIRTRFPPEPNGYLHIGHAKAICLDFGIAREFGGRCNLRFDDTNPAREDPEFVNAIQEDVRWLGFEWSSLRHASDYFEVYYLAAEKLIKDGKAFVCDLSAEQVREYRGTLTEPGRNSPWRDRSIEENLDLFRRMRAGEFPDGARTLRARIDMASGNINLRDPALYRIKHMPHPIAGEGWCIYPMYDFAHALGDAIEGITHSLCTL